MTHQASGTFDVRLNPQGGDDLIGAPDVRRLAIDKEFHGDLEALSKGQMLAAATGVEDSAGYVAIEQVSGTLHGRRGAFILQHNGIMDRGQGRLTVTVVPDSGTDELTGLSGQMNIIIVDGEHRYEFEYSLGKIL